MVPVTDIMVFKLHKTWEFSQFAYVFLIYRFTFFSINR